MFSTIFSIPGCPFCKEMAKAVLLANPSLPIDQKIWFTNVHWSDSTMNYLHSKFPDGRYRLPYSVIDTPYYNGRNSKERVVLYGASTKETNVQVIKMLNNQVIYNLY